MFQSVTGSNEGGVITRRSVLVGGTSALALGALAHAGLREATAQEVNGTPAAATPEGTEGDAQSRLKALQERLEAYGYLWTATSPATHLGDTYTLSATNAGSAPVKLLVVTVIMDLREQQHEVVVQEEFELAVGASREMTATNSYGTVNHIATWIATDAAETTALTLSVMIVDENGDQTASFNERAFMIESRDDLEAKRQSRREARKERREGLRKRIAQRRRGMDEESMDATPEATES